MYAACWYTPSAHVNQRMVERNLNWLEILFVLQHGMVTIDRRGRYHYFLRSEDIPPMVNVNKRYDHLVGITVIVDRRKRIVITAYRQQQLYC